MATVKDPICGKDVDTLRARAVGIFGGVTYYFCSQECKSKFVDPRKAPRETKPAPPASKKDPTPARRDPSLETLPPMTSPPSSDDEELPDLTPAKARPLDSPSVIAEVRDLKKGSRRWALLIVILFAVVVAAAVLSLRN